MKAFYGSQISENMTKTPEGFLICFNVPIARTGWYDYLAQEIGLEGQHIVKVYRSPGEVFSKQAIASFEGKIATDEHPPDLLTPQNAERFTRGAVQNVRQSTTEKDLLVADLIIYNDILIDEIMNKGKREVSCGYECSYSDNGDGTYNQVQICGNHVAVVESGRAGDRVAIKDSKIKEMEGEKKKMNKVKIPKKQSGPITNLFAAMGFKHFVTDAEPEEIANALDALAEERETGNDEVPEQFKKEEEKEKVTDEDGLTALTAKVDSLAEVVSKLVEGNKTNDEKPEDTIDEMIEELSKDENTAGEEENSVTVPVDEMDEDTVSEDEETIKSADSAAMVKALIAMKPVIAAIKDPIARQKACDSLKAEFSKVKKATTKGNGYQQILAAQKNNSVSKAQKAADSSEKRYQEIENSYARSNPHNKKKEMK